MVGHDDVRPTSPSVKLTYEDFLQFPDDGKRHELIDGEHYATPSPVPRHQVISWNLTLLLGTYLRHHPVGRAFAAPLDVVFSTIDVVEPDLLFINRDRIDDVLTDKHVTGPPDLVVEIVSPGTRRRDEGIKRRLYERFGVAEYWVIDPDLETIRVYRRGDDTYAPAVELALERADILTTPLLPGLALRLTDVFAET